MNTDLDLTAIANRAKATLIRTLGDRRANEHLIDIVADEEFCLEPPESYETFLAREYLTPQYRIAGLWPTGGTALLAAYRKTGKSTMVQNVIRSLDTGEPFLGCQVAALAKDESIVHVNFEVDARTQQYYARPFGAFSNVYIHNLRGRARQFNILNDGIRTRIASQLADLNTTILILDPLGPLLRTFGLDENKNSSEGGGALVEAVNALVDEACLSEALLVHHTGHGSQWRARGSSVFGDAPDVLWNYRLGRHKMEDQEAEDTKDHIDPNGRYFSATGRLDTDFLERRVYFNQRTHRLSLTPFIMEASA